MVQEIFVWVFVYLRYNVHSIVNWCLHYECIWWRFYYDFFPSVVEEEKKNDYQGTLLQPSGNVHVFAIAAIVILIIRGATQMIYNAHVVYGIHYTLLSVDHLFLLRAANNRLTSPIFFFVLSSDRSFLKKSSSLKVPMLHRNNPRLISIEVCRKLYKLSQIVQFIIYFQCSGALIFWTFYVNGILSCFKWLVL